MLSINIERVGANSKLILIVTTIIIHKFFVNVQIHNISHKLIQFHLCKFYAKKNIQVLVVTKHDHALTVLQELNNNNVKVIITNETNKITFLSIQPIFSANQL